MPVSYLPCFTTGLLILIPIIRRIKGGNKGARVGVVISLLVAAAIILSVYIPGWRLHARASAGDPAAQYEFARWTENHCEELQNILIWPCGPDLLAGYAWLEKSAAQDYPPAVYLVGVRLKYGDFVPKPPGWKGPDQNMYPQPARGQELIDRALRLGFKPPSGDDRSYYFGCFRRGEI